jgi:AcrR family transcriptional regulator
MESSSATAGVSTRREATRQKLYEAAVTLIAEQGFSATTVDEIAERAGTGRTTFFRNFRSKEDVIFPDHERLLAAVRERLSTATPDTATVAVTEAARVVLQEYLAEGDRARTRYALVATVPALRDRETASIGQYQRLFREFLVLWLGDGDPAALRAELLANAVVTAHNHVLRRWLRRETDGPEADLDSALAEVVELYLSRPEDTDASDAVTALLVVRTRKELDDALPRIRRMLT